MRCAAGAGMLVLAGCNQVFGIGATTGFDASMDVTVDMPHVELTWQIAQVIETPPAQPEPADLGDPDPQMRFPPISPAPRVRIATMAGGFEDAVYSPTDGWILIPRDYLGTPWRLEYTLADNVPHEVQWAPDDKRGRITVPMLGRIARDAAPSNSGYTITPNGVSAAYSFPRVLTTGLWTEGAITSSATGPDGHTLDYDFANSNPLSGANGRPEHARGDRALLVDYTVDGNGCRSAIGAADFSPDLILAVHKPVTPTWDVRALNVLPPPSIFDVLTRLTHNLGALGGRTVAGTILIGRTASLLMPSLDEVAPALPLPVPVMQTLVACPYNTSVPKVLTPQALDDFPLIEHFQLSVPRAIEGTTLTVSSGMESVVTTVAGSNELRFDVAFPAAFPTLLQLTPAGGDPIDLVGGTSDHLPIPLAELTLGFTAEAIANTRADYYDVVLYKVDASALTVQRIYTVTAPTVRIDRSVLAPATEYVFEVRSYKGRPMAAHGDFVSVDYPYGAAILVTHTFKTP